MKGESDFTPEKQKRNNLKESRVVGEWGDRKLKISKVKSVEKGDEKNQNQKEGFLDRKKTERVICWKGKNQKERRE